MRLEVGAGKKPTAGYTHLDICTGNDIELVCASWKIPIEDNSVEEVYARHFFEHLSPDEAGKTLIEWKRILKDGGLVHIIIPDITYHAEQLLLGGKSEFVDASNFDHAMAGFYGWSTKDDNMRHKYGYTKCTIKQLFLGHGFDNVQFKECRRCDIDLVAYKAGI